MIEHINSNNSVLAILIRQSFRAEGIKFLTPNNYSQQLGYMNRPQGYQIQPHIHNKIPREVHFTNEVLFIKSGTVRVDFYDEDKLYVGSKIIITGDILLLVSGGHGFEMIEDSEIIEVKQGPYAGDEDKTHFRAASTCQIKLI